MVNCKIEKKYLFPAVYKLVKTFFGESTVLAQELLSVGAMVIFVVLGDAIRERCI